MPTPVPSRVSWQLAANLIIVAILGAVNALTPEPVVADWLAAHPTAAIWIGQGIAALNYVLRYLKTATPATGFLTAERSR